MTCLHVVILFEVLQELNNGSVGWKGDDSNPGQISSSPPDGTKELALVLLVLSAPPFTGFYCQLANCRKKI